MPPAASSIFDFLTRHETFTFQRHEIRSASFGELRRALASIVKLLRETGDEEAVEISDQIRTLLFTWLTAPIEFSTTELDAVRSFGEATAFEMRWGLHGQYKSALLTASKLTQEKNLMREQVGTILCELRKGGVPFKIFCHRKARSHFDSLFTPPLDAILDESCFLHTVGDYNKTPPFTTLIKIGPLRSAGWGAAPDAIISAPRFENLIQLVWSGCADELGFGYDPVGPPPPNVTTQMHAPAVQHDALVNNVTWTRTVTCSGDDPLVSVDYSVGDDEFCSLREPGQLGIKRPATMVEIAEGGGILYPPNSEILSYDPAPDVTSPFALRRFNETMITGMYVILTQIGDVDFGSVLASDGQYSQIWKKRLNEEMRSNPYGICRILRNSGVELRGIRSRVESWCKPSSTVIHAPQQLKHFKILIQVLSIDPIHNPNSTAGISWWQRAWNEIRISRGEAIQAGFQEHEVVEQQALGILNGLRSEVGEKTSLAGSFRIAIPDGNELRGGFVFHKVTSIEEGFLVPEIEIRVVRDLNTIDQWRKC